MTRLLDLAAIINARADVLLSSQGRASKAAFNISIEAEKAFPRIFG